MHDLCHSQPQPLGKPLIPAPKARRAKVYGFLYPQGQNVHPMSRRLLTQLDFATRLSRGITQFGGGASAQIVADIEMTEARMAIL